MFDLHVHTTASDGEFSPSEIIKKAKDLGLDTISITDHDTIDGIKEAIEYSKKININFIPGIELDAYVTKGKMHILGYYYDINDTNFSSAMSSLKKEREDRNDKFIKEFQKQGINIKIEDIKKYAIGNIIAKPHFARALLDNGYIEDIEEAYSNFFNASPMKDIKRKSISPEEAIALIKNAGGIAVLAHPISLKLTYDELETKIKELKKIGLDGIECYNSIHSPEDIEELLKIAEAHDMLITGGSDYHGPISTPNYELSKGKNNNISNMPTQIVSNLSSYKKNNINK